jgi:HK97 family phage major capsid protein
MDEKELEKLMNGVAEKNKAAIKTEIEAATAGLMKADELATKLEAIGISKKEIETLTKAVETQGEEMRKYFERGKSSQKSMDEVINEKASEIAKVAKGEARVVKFDLPRINKTLVQRSGFADNTLGYRIPGIGELEYLQPVIASIFRSVDIGENTNGVVRYVDQAAATRNAATRAEGSAAPESAISWIEKTATLQKISDSIPVTKEALRDIGFVKGEIERLLNINLGLKEDSQLYAGDGVAPNIKGIYEYAVTAQAAVGAAPYVDTVDSANLYDLIAVLRTVIMLRGQNKYSPNYVLLNPADVLKYKLVKGTDGHYVLPPFISADGKTIDTVRVIESQQVTANTLQIGDSRYGTIYRIGGIEMEIGMVNNQFLEGKLSLMATQTEYLLVRDADANAFGKITDVTAALALLETP